MDLIYYLIAVIDLLIDFVISNIGFVVGIIILIAGMVSTRKKAKKAKEAEEASREYHQRRFSGGQDTGSYEESPAPKPFVKTFKELMAEIETELSEKNEEKPWDFPQEGRGSAEGRPQRTPSGYPEGGSAYPRKAPVQPKVRTTNVPPTPTAKPAEVFVPGDLTAADVEIKPRKKAAKRNDLVTAVVMSEVLGKPKGLQD